MVMAEIENTDNEYRSYMHDNGLSCPACETAAEDGVLEDMAPRSISSTAYMESEDTIVRVDLGPCGRCETPLHLLTMTALPEAMGVDVCLEVPPEAREP